MTNLFKKLFTTPEYLSFTRAGIEVSSRSIRYIEFSHQKGILLVKKYGEVELPLNTVKDGEILNKDAFTKALASVKSNITADVVIVSIPEESSYIFDIIIPRMKSAEIRQALEFKLEENVPLKVDEVIFEYEVIDTYKKTSGDMLVSVSVIPKKIIAGFSEALASAGLTPFSYEVESRMTARAVVPSRDHRTCMVINIKDDATVMSLVVRDVVRFTSTIGLGDKNILESLQKDSNPTKNTPKSLSSFVDTEDTDSLVNIFSIIKDEVEKFNNYIVSKASDAKNNLPATIDQIILCGKSASVPGLANHIAQNINAEVICANVWTNIFRVDDSLPAIKFQDSLNFATAIGLAIPHDKK